jgi:hypothetical protein
MEGVVVLRLDQILADAGLAAVPLFEFDLTEERAITSGGSPHTAVYFDVADPVAGGTSTRLHLREGIHRAVAVATLPGGEIERDRRRDAASGLVGFLEFPLESEADRIALDRVETDLVAGLDHRVRVRAGVYRDTVPDGFGGVTELALDDRDEFVAGAVGGP